VSTTLIHDESDKPLYFITSIIDITERKRLQEELLNSKEEKFRKIFDNAKYGIMLVDLENRQISMVNPEFCKMLGYENKEIIGVEISAIHPEKDLVWVIDEFEKHINAGGGASSEIPVKRKDGSVFVADINSTIVKIEDKQFIAGFFHDISDRKKAEKELKESRFFLESIVENIPNMIFVKDANDLKFTLFNKAGEELLGYPRESMLGKSDYDFFPKEQADFFINTDKGVLNGKKEVNIPEEKIQTKFKGERILHTKKIPIMDEMGSPLYLLGISEDITDRKIDEAEKRAVEKMRTSSEIKSRFTSMVSHELRSPLAAIKEAANIVIEGLAGSISNEQKEMMAIVKRNSDRLGRLINNVLDFQKFQSGKMECVFNENDINEAVNESCSSMSLLMKEKCLVFSIDMDAGIPRIKFDFDKIIQVITNLISNAIKVTEKGAISLTTKLEDDMAHVFVRDTGPGIKIEDIEKLFVPFEQLDVPREKKRGAGTGLGLAICKEIILAHNGKIWVESEVGKGSSFHFTIPIIK